MASSYIVALMFVTVQLLVVWSSSSHAASDLVESFTIMNHLPKDDFLHLTCDCLDVNGIVATFTEMIDECEDREFQASRCPSGWSASKFFCKFMYYKRSGTSTSYLYININVWTSSPTGPKKTYYKMDTKGVYGSTESQNPSTQISVWREKEYFRKHLSLGNGETF